MVAMRLCQEKAPPLLMTPEQIGRGRVSSRADPRFFPSQAIRK